MDLYHRRDCFVAARIPGTTLAYSPAVGFLTAILS